MSTLTLLYRSKLINNIRGFKNEMKYLNLNYDRSLNLQQKCKITTNGNCYYGAATIASSTTTSSSLPGALSKKQAKELAVRLTSSERSVLISALQECQSQKIKAEYEVETVPQPQKKDLLRVSFANAIPFVGFGFLDNFIMIIAGEHIEAQLGVFISLSTMAAAALGNTISDILGIGSAYYVELMAQKIGFKPPKLTPIQLDLPRSRRAANLGRVIGVTIGCILGMTPLLWLEKKSDKKETEEKVEIV
ncbi:transmembrane protein 65 isoform X3 [Aphidius gifuensis]|uniref:transmembrane protein 65 isoform X3 n=1 Tax=Aphidius gifuensis TaxID=684658 RepID=UPI001CDB9929|nr:transmembrane protein 65 isoform X3 [Aphidius gifuensis]